MLSTVLSAFTVAEIRKKLAFTAMILALYRLGSHVPVPGIDVQAVQDVQENFGGSNILGLLNTFTGGALSQIALFALGIMPYITASIILQLLVVVIPRLEELKKEGQAGQAKITQYTRYLTIALAVLQSTGIIALARSGRLFPDPSIQVIPDDSLFRILVLVVTMTAGTAVIMWLGELITDRGVGNGMSVLIFTSIISSIPGQAVRLYQSENGPITVVAIALLALIVIAIAGGATVLSHVNDSGFWLVSRFFRMDEKTTLKTWTVMETLLGTIGFLLALALSLFL